MSSAPAVKTMRLRYAGTCGGCSRDLASGERAHYLRATKTVRCLACGPGDDAVPVRPATGPPTPAPAAKAAPATAADPAVVEIVQGPLPRAARCSDCGRGLRRGTDALTAPAGAPVLCLECLALDMVHSIGVREAVPAASTTSDSPGTRRACARLTRSSGD